MTDYIREIQRQFVEVYHFPTNKEGLPTDVPDGEYPMTIENKVDKVRITKGKIGCCNFEEKQKPTSKKKGKNKMSK
jgi:hypothetical protein